MLQQQQLQMGEQQLQMEEQQLQMEEQMEPIFYLSFLNMIS